MRLFAVASRAAVWAVLACALLLVACDESTEPQATSTAPPYVNPTSTYPDVVATVNGDPIGGLALAQVEAAAEVQAQNWPENLPEVDQDGLDFLIDQRLMLQAADRLGLQPTREEVEEHARTEEERLNNLPPDQRLEFETLMAAQGLPTDNFTANETLMAVYEESLKLVNFRKYIRELVAQEQGIPVNQVTPPQEGEAQDAFLADERANADIIVLVARPTPIAP